MLTKYPIVDKDEKGQTNQPASHYAAVGEVVKIGIHEGEEQRCATQPDPSHWAQRTVIVATNAAETGVTFENCMYL